MNEHQENASWRDDKRAKGQQGEHVVRVDFGFVKLLEVFIFPH